MAKPKVILDNYQQVYDFYEQYRQPRRTAQFAYAVLNRRYKPVVHYAPEAREQYSELRGSGTPQIFVFNHLTNHSDQFVASAIAHQTVPEDVGNTRVLAKDELFRGVQRHFVDMMGAVPVFRKKNHANIPELQGRSDEEIEQLLELQAAKVDAGTEALIASTGNMVAAGQNLAIFAEGSHNKVDPTIVQKLRPGFARTALHAYARDTSVAITPIGMSFGPALDTLDPRRAVAVIAPSLFVSQLDTEDSLVTAIRADLQDAVSVANDIWSDDPRNAR